MPLLHVLRVFVAENGTAGNRLGVFLAGAEVPAGERQRVAAELGFAETVFVEDREHGALRIFTPAEELPFAGHPLVGTAWLLAHEGAAPDCLRPPAGTAAVRRDGELTWIAGRPEWAPAIEYVQLGSAAEVEALSGPGDREDPVYFWAWADEAAGRVRSRGFFPTLGISEDEATGAAALALCGGLGRAIEVTQGSGSRLYARPIADGLVEVGGRVTLEERREHPLSA